MENLCSQCEHYISIMIRPRRIVHKCKKYHKYINPEDFWKYPECEDYKKKEVYYIGGRIKDE